MKIFKPWLLFFLSIWRSANARAGLIYSEEKLKPPQPTAACSVWAWDTVQPLWMLDHLFYTFPWSDPTYIIITFARKTGAFFWVKVEWRKMTTQDPFYIFLYGLELWGQFRSLLMKFGGCLLSACEENKDFFIILEVISSCRIPVPWCISEMSTVNGHRLSDKRSSEKSH